MQISHHFRRLSAPGTGRLTIQLFLLDVADLRSLDPLDRSLLHSDGLNDLHTPALFQT